MPKKIVPLSLITIIICACGSGNKEPEPQAQDTLYSSEEIILGDTSTAEYGIGDAIPVGSTLTTSTVPPHGTVMSPEEDAYEEARSLAEEDRLARTRSHEGDSYDDDEEDDEDYDDDYDEGYDD